jgi:hypothetical protein
MLGQNLKLKIISKELESWNCHCGPIFIFVLNFFNSSNHKLTKAPKKNKGGKTKEQNGRTHIQEDKWTT